MLSMDAYGTGLGENSYGWKSQKPQQNRQQYVYPMQQQFGQQPFGGGAAPSSPQMNMAAYRSGQAQPIQPQSQGTPYNPQSAPTMWGGKYGVNGVGPAVPMPAYRPPVDQGAAPDFSVQQPVGPNQSNWGRDYLRPGETLEQLRQENDAARNQRPAQWQLPPNAVVETPDFNYRPPGSGRPQPIDPPSTGTPYGQFDPAPRFAGESSRGVPSDPLARIASNPSSPEYMALSNADKAKAWAAWMSYRDASANYERQRQSQTPLAQTQASNQAYLRALALRRQDAERQMTDTQDARRRLIGSRDEVAMSDASDRVIAAEDEYQRLRRITNPRYQGGF